MAKPEHLETLGRGVKAWNEWRDRNPDVNPDLGEAELVDCSLRGYDLRGADLAGTILRKTDLRDARLANANLTGSTLSGANLSGADLCGASLNGANLWKANLRSANLQNATLHAANLIEANLNDTNLYQANLRQASLAGAQLIDANLACANLSAADLSRAYICDSLAGGADFRCANLFGTSLLRTDFSRANLSGCKVFGVSAWGVNLEEAVQSDLMITDTGESYVCVDYLELAQFVYLLLSNRKIRQVLGAITSKVVLILGSFREGRKDVLDAIRGELRRLGYVPIVFDFERPESQVFTETITTLAGMSRFVIADITSPRSSPLELQATIPNYMIPFAPIIKEGEEPFSMFADLQHRFHWVLDLLVYSNIQQLVAALRDQIVRPALEKHAELLLQKAQEIRVRQTP